MKPIAAPLLVAAVAFAAALPAAAEPALDAYAAQHFNAGVAVADRQTEPTSAIALPSRAGDGNGALSTWAAEHFNRGVAVADRQTAVPPAAAPDPALDAYAAAHFNHGVAVADRQTEPN